jgi:hypothetical protein
MADPLRGSGPFDRLLGLFLGNQLIQWHPTKFAPGALDVGFVGWRVLESLGECFGRECDFLHVRKPPKQKSTKPELLPGMQSLQLVFQG